MRKWILLVLFALLMASCTAAPQPTESSVPQEDDSYEEEESVVMVYTPDYALSPEETVEAYFEQQYFSYINFSEIDLGSIVDMNQTVNSNAHTWVQLLNQRRRLIWENDYCYVETEMHPYTIRYLEEEELGDQRMEYWRSNDMLGDEETILHLVVEGEKGHAYPPMLAVNSHHTIRLAEIDGGWKIASHYFPGAVRKFRRYNYMTAISDEEALAQLEQEFSAVPQPASLPQGADTYDESRAAEYAKRYTESPHEVFYNIGDWMGNCANFISQCVWYGMGGATESDIHGGKSMTVNWYGGTGGGSPAWENVEYFWEDIIRPDGLAGTVLEGAAALQTGDIIQTKAAVGTEDERFNHTLLVVNPDTLVLAQNSPGCFVYYSDLVYVQKRFVRPAHLA